MYKILIRRVLILIIPYFMFQASLSAQQTRSSEGTRLLEKEKLQELEALLILPKLEKEKKIMFDISGWFSSTARYYEDTDNNKAVSDSTKESWLQDLRLWASWIFNQRHLLYIRLKDLYYQRTNGDGYTNIGDDHDGPHIDNAYLSLSLGTYTPNELTFGRQYIYIGRGISYSAVHDGIKFLIMPQDFFVKTFFAQALNHEEDIDISIPGYDKQSERIFSGIELAWRGLKNNIFYAYFLSQRHLLDENPAEDYTQSYNYESEYIGLGIEGKKDNISYWGELIKEYGKSFTDAAQVSLEKKNIDAWAADAGIRKDFNITLSPSIELEYAYGSGDDDRNSVTDTTDGNIYGDDENFLYFGDFFSGYALETRLSNIHILKAEAAIKPFSKTTRFNLDKLNIGTKYFWYRKDKSGGATYDTESTLDNNDIGQEIDIYLYWKLTKNLNLAFRGGIFFPGDAYPENTDDPAKYLYLRTTLYF